MSDAKQFSSFSGLAADLPATSIDGVHYTIRDATSPTDCTNTGGGSDIVECVCINGAWTAVPTSSGSGGGGTVDPATLSGVKVDLDAAQDAVNFNDGDAVGTATNWGTGGNFSQATAGKKPTFKTNILNGLPVYRFDGGDCLVSNAPIGLSTFDVFVVFTATAHGFIYEQSAASDANDGSSLYTDFAQARVRRTQVSNRGTNPTGYGGDLDQWRVMSHEYAGTHQTHRLWIDGAYVFTQAAAGTGPTASTSTITDTIYVGGRNDTAFFVTGDIARLLIVDKLSTANADGVKLFLRQRYKL